MADIERNTLPSPTQLIRTRRPTVPSKVHAYQRLVLSIKCPLCRRANGHWCRDEQGKAIPPHRERSKAALAVAGSVFQSLTERKSL